MNAILNLRTERKLLKTFCPWLRTSIFFASVVPSHWICPFCATKLRLTEWIFFVFTSPSFVVTFISSLYIFWMLTSRLLATFKFDFTGTSIRHSTALASSSAFTCVPKSSTVSITIFWSSICTAASKLAKNFVTFDETFSLAVSFGCNEIRSKFPSGQSSTSYGLIFKW